MGELLEGDRFRRNAESIIDFLDKDAPTPILAMAVMLLFRTAWVTCGDDMAYAFGQWMRTQTRSEHGLCQMCDTTVFPPQHPQLCEQHEAEVDTMSQELADGNQD